MLNKYLCEVVYSEKLAEDIVALTVVNKQLAEKAVAGQFLHIKCGHSRILRRPISICSIRASAIEIVFEIKGEGTRWLSRRKHGSFLDVLGPLGNGYDMPEGKAIVVGGGLGVPPMLFAADSARNDVAAILGFRSHDRVILHKEFEAVCEKVIVTTEDGSYGKKGTAIEPLRALLASGEYSCVMACGAPLMLRAVAQICKELGAPLQVSLEERMGCGVGACLVCACATKIDGEDEMSRVCMDGPVFSADVVNWDNI
ncbi:MAG: dihydroorotate dehydrogenase electron transfer subunit [Oscillospiraceae bacterium]|nr:dihydroorotate dehydrogenase electron transfer subunit [Oscillospiraceae bacterium]